MSAQEDKLVPDVISATILVYSLPARVLYDSGASVSFVSYEFSKNLSTPPNKRVFPLEVEIADSKVVVTSNVYHDVEIEINDSTFRIDLIPIMLGEFNIVIRMDWLNKYNAAILCSQTLVRVVNPQGREIIIYGDKRQCDFRLCFVRKAGKYLSHGCYDFMEHVIDTSFEKKSVNDVPVVNEFLDVFPEDFRVCRPMLDKSVIVFIDDNLVYSKSKEERLKVDPSKMIAMMNWEAPKSVGEILSFLGLAGMDQFKDLLRACPHHYFTELHQLDTFYNGLNPSDQDSLNSAAGGNLLERSAQDVLKIIENKSKVRNSINKPIVSQGKATPASVKAIEDSCVTCGGTHSYRQCPATDGNTFLGYQDNIQGYVSAAAVNYNQGNTGYRPQSVANQFLPPGFAQPNVQNQGFNQNRGNNFNQGNTSYQASIQQTQVVTSRPLPSNTIGNPKGGLKAITTQSGIVLDGPSVPMPPPFINPEEDDRAEETLTDLDLDEYTIKVPPPLVQKPQAPSQKSYEMPKRDPLHPNIPYPSRMYKEKQQDKDEIKIHKFWQMFKQLHINITFADALILIPNYQKMLKALLSKKEKLLELTNIPLNENCSTVILKKLPKKLRDLGKFLISCGFSELKCKALADLGASINLMPFLVWKNLGLPELISTRMTLELANRSVCTPIGIARDVFVLVGRFTFPIDFVIVDYESDPRVLLILGRTFLRTARALIDVYGEELILHDGNERLILNMKRDTSSYSNKPQRESIHMIDIYNISYEYYLEDLFANEKITNHLNLPPSHNINPLSGSTTSSSASRTTFEISNYSLEEFADELALIESFLSRNDDMTPEDVIREIKYLLNRDPLAKYSHNYDLIYTILEMFTDEHTLDYSSLPRYDDTNDDLFDLKTDNDEWGKRLSDDPFDSNENKIKDSEFLIDELDSHRSSTFLPHFLESDSVPYEDFSEVDTLTSTDNEDKVFNLGILVHENLYEVTNRVTPDKNVKKISSSNASLILEDYNPPLSDHELPFHLEIPVSRTLLSFSFKNEEKVFYPGFSFLKEFIHFYRNYLIGTLKLSKLLIF
uniref:Reverse transcriptase domain-containing protein n=1 Tax=Tanacetum cinerariifolium TaxID=118510 RepID=A0A6L2MFT9_TANCI|nr:reverse transcriptase domain-containing protein [Tanacetum cinerariifolium]